MREKWQYEIEPSDLQRQVGARVKQARLEAKMTQREVGEALDVTGATVNRWEKAIPPPDLRALEGLAALFGKPLDWFLGRTEDHSEQIAEAMTAIFRQVLKGETPVAAFESVTAEAIPLAARDRRWLTERAQAFRDEFAQQTGRDLQSLSDQELDRLLRPFLAELRRPVGRKKNGR